MTAKKFSALLAVPFIALSLSACSSDSKPSREDVISGMDKIFDELGTKDQYTALGGTDEQINEFYECVTNEIYDKVSDETLRAFADGKVNGSGNAGDQDALNESAFSCGQELGQKIAGNAAG